MLNHLRATQCLLSSAGACRLNHFQLLRPRCLSFSRLRSARDSSDDTDRPMEQTRHVVYRFPYIKHVRVLCRMKLYQTAFTLVLMPVVCWTGSGSAVLACGASGFAVVMLAVMGEFFRRFIGILQLEADGRSLVISHLTFWGGRRDVAIPLQDIVPVTDGGERISDLYFSLRRFSSKREYYFMSLRFGGVVDKHKLETIIGSFSGTI